jgi:hypothetical protein
MNNILTGTNSKILLIGKIKGLANESKRTRKLLLKSKSEEKVHRFDCTRRVIGLDIRHHLLAYAFMRGTPYHKLERTCREDNRPNPTTIHKIVLVHDSPFNHLMGHSLDDVTAWLKGS